MASSVLITTASLVLLALLMVHIASFTGPAGVTERVHNTIDGGVFSMRGVEVPLPSSFTGIPAIDGWLSIVVVVFSQLQLYPADPPAYWQSLVFLTELAGVYAIFLAESCRDVNRSTVLRWPSVLFFVGQLATAGLSFPIFLIILLIQVRRRRSSLQDDGTIPTVQSAALFPAVVIGYYVPHFASYLHPSYEARIWWCCVWQFYPVWGAVTFWLFSKVLGPSVSQQSSRQIRLGTAFSLAVVNAAVYHWMLWGSGLSLVDMFFPKYLLQSPPTPDAFFRNLLQYDYICSFSAVFVWLSVTVASKEQHVTWYWVVGLGVVMSGIFGFGSTMLLLWTWRDALESDEISGGRKEESTKTRAWLDIE